MIGPYLEEYFIFKIRDLLITGLSKNLLLFTFKVFDIKEWQKLFSNYTSFPCQKWELEKLSCNVYFISQVKQEFPRK